MHFDVNICGAWIWTQDLCIQKRVCYQLHHSAPLCKLSLLHTLRLCNWSVLLWTVTLLSCNMHYITLAIVSRLSRFPFPAVGTNWPFCVDVPLNNQPTNTSVILTAIDAYTRLLVHRVFLPVDVFHSIVSDQGREFCNQILQLVLLLLLYEWHSHSGVLCLDVDV